MSWFLIALLGPALWSICNHFDKYIVSKYFKGGAAGALVIFSGLIGLVVIPIPLLNGTSLFSIPVGQILVLIVSGIIYILGLIPYIMAMTKADASVVVPLYQLIPVFSYLLGLAFLQESLTTAQILGAGIVILGAVGILTDIRRFKFNWEVFLLMALASLLAAVDSTIFKFYTVTADFWLSSFWVYIGYVLCALGLYSFYPRYRQQFNYVFTHNSAAILSLNTVQEVINVSAKIAVTFAATLAPLALVWTVNGFQPVFVFIYGVVLTLLFPKSVQEDISRQTLLQKMLFIAIICLGAVVINLNGI